MHDPESYESFSDFQRRDARELVPYLTSRMSWKKCDNVLDFGCGSGHITRDVLLPCIKKYREAFANTGGGDNSNRIGSFNLKFKEEVKLYGIDISKNMIDFASTHHSHPNISYMVADILKEDSEFPCRFDKIFSLHVLHWIPDQERVLSRLHELLKTNGEIGFYYLSNAAVFSVYENMSQLPMWSAFMKDVKKFIPKSHYSSDAARDMKELMNSVGFRVQECGKFLKTFTFPDTKTLTDAAMAANPFIHRIPDSMVDEYREDFQHAFLPFLQQARTDQESRPVEVEYEVVVIRARKG